MKLGEADLEGFSEFSKEFFKILVNPRKIRTGEEKNIEDFKNQLRKFKATFFVTQKPKILIQLSGNHQVTLILVPILVPRSHHPYERRVLIAILAKNLTMVIRNTILLINLQKNRK